MFPKLLLLQHRLLWNLGSLIGRGCLIVLGLAVLSLGGCGSGGEQEINTPAVATISLRWDPINNPSIIGYFIHYGKRSPNQPGSCAYEHAQFVLTPHGIVTGLDLGSVYSFAVSAYNGVESNCSNEVFAHT